jgi:hypothetical protein
MRNIIIFLVVSLVLFSCEKTIQIDIPDNGRKLVVNSFFGADSVLMVSLTESQYILDSKPEFEKVSNAEISLFEEGSFIEKLQETIEGDYKGTYILRADKNYKLEVKAGNYPELLTESYIPRKTEMNKLEVINTKDEEGYEAIGFTLNFKDDPQAENFYFIQVYEHIKEHGTSYETGNDTVYIYDNKMYLYSTDPNAYSDDWYLDDGLLLNDDLLNGKEYSLKFFGYGGYGYYYSYYDEFGNPIEQDNLEVTYYVSFYSVSKAYYLYYKTLAKHLAAQDEFFMEPVQAYTNVENGFGIFAGYSVDIDSAKIQN